MKQALIALIAVAIGLGLVLGVHVAVSRGSDPQASASERPGRRTAEPASPTDLAQLRQQITRLEREVQSVTRRQPAAVDPGLADSAAPASGAAPSRMDPAARAEAERLHRARVASIDAAFQREPVEPRWSTAMASAVTTAVAGDDHLQRLTRSVECRSRTCRVEVADDGSARMQRTVLKFAQRVGRELPDVVFGRNEDTGGAPTIVLYMSRPDPT